MHQLLYWLAVSLFIFFATLVVASSRAAFILRSQFPTVWEAEGRPVRWLYLNRMPSNRHFFGFLDERRYLATGSPSYARLCSIIRLGWYLLLFWFAGLFVGVIIAVFSSGAA